MATSNNCKSHFYVPIWEQYKNEIIQCIQSGGGVITMNGDDFKRAGNRPAAGYSFHLDITNGVIPTKSGCAVARDLKIVLESCNDIRKTLAVPYITIKLTKKFELQISLI